VNEEQGFRARSLIGGLFPDWRLTEARVQSGIRKALVVIVLIAFVAISRLSGVTFMNLLKALAVPITVGAAVP
jgi:hypothetical protein